MHNRVQDSSGSFYGIAYAGGASFAGAVFKISVPLDPPANQISSIQLAGNDAAVSIPSVAGKTYQLQFASDLSIDTWSSVPSAVVSNSVGALLTLTNFGGAVSPQGFYRFVITP